MENALLRFAFGRFQPSRAMTMEMMDAISGELRKTGFKYVALDCTGFRSGSLNAVLPAEVLMRRGA